LIADETAFRRSMSGLFKMKIHIVIPARLASTRLPEKLLLRAGGKSVLQHTYEAACRATTHSGVTVAVDDGKLEREVRSFGGHVMMTSTTCQSGTDRLAEVAATLDDVEIFVNVQGDEPEIDPAAIDLVAATLIASPWAAIATVARPIRDMATLENSNSVKAVIGREGRALYFSRAAVPYVRDQTSESMLAAEPPLFWHHLGLYAYRREFLHWFASQRVGRLEQVEKLEQLRALEAGHSIVVARIDAAPAGIDTQVDFDAFAARLSR
jgi:3-deoxy-manno-octulosonate cytidylyltransferase (CMP-KDO synthetase)